MGRTKERNAKIELIRVLACFLVILNHIMIMPTSGDGQFYFGTAILVAIIWTDVPLFLIISGFLMFQNAQQEEQKSLWDAYVHKLINFFVYVFIPSCIIVFLSGMIAPYLNGEATLQSILADGNLHLECIKNYIFKQNATSIYSVFWYIWTYAKIVMFFPLLAAVCQDTKDKNAIRRFLMILSGLNIAFVDLQGMVQKSIGNFDSITLDKYFLYVLLGYELYLISGKIKAEKMRFYGIAILIVSILGTVGVEALCFYRSGNAYMPVIFTVTASVGMFLFLYSLPEPRFGRVWNKVGKSTLYIYMVHIIVIFSCQKIWGDFFWNLFGEGSNFMWLILYDAIYGSIIFAISFAIGIVFKIIYEKIFVKIAGKLLVSVSGMRKATNE